MRERSVFRLLVVLLGVLALVGFTACGDDDDTTTAATTTTEAEGAAEPDDPAAAEEEIRTNISTLFVSLGEMGAAMEAGDDAAAAEAQAEVVTYIENGEAQADSVATVAPLAAGGLEVVIDSVTFTSDTTADFQYDILVGGNPSGVTDSTGEAVLQDGTWKLSEEIWQALLAIAGGGGGGGGGEEGGGEEGA